MKTRLFLSCMVLLALALVGPRLDAEEENAAAQPEPAHIVVRADEVLAPVSPLLFGQNYGPWMDTTDVYVDFYRGVGVTLLRFPAGNWGTTRVAAESSDEPLLPTFASLRDDGALALIVINKDPAQAREATLSIEGFRLAGQAQVWLQDEEHLGVELPAVAVAETFPYAFPPYSVTLFILEPARWGDWSLWAGLVLAAVALAVLAIVLGRRVRRSR